MVEPIPCTNVQERTIRQWFAKLDEELNEVKDAVLACYLLDDYVSEDNADDAELKAIALECADLITAATSFQAALRIGRWQREISQNAVNQSNMERGRI